MIYYKDIDTQLFEVKNSGGWFIAADSKEDALGLANKRGEYQENDIVPIGSCSTILGKSDNYENVINMRDKLNAL